jgi:hypothetical protein
MAASAPAAPTAAVTDQRPRCWRCNRELAVLLTRPWHLDCPRCHAPNKRDALASGLSTP